VAVAIEGSGSTWGVPEFRFSDGGANINGGTAVPAGAPVGTEYPVGTARTLCALPAPRTTFHVEIRIASGGSGTRGLYEVIFSLRDERLAQCGHQRDRVVDHARPDALLLRIDDARPDVLG
jgi:hypothetical protein